MRFGVFIPQGWRLDLVGIDPARHWEVMRELAQHADAGPWESLWVYDHFHTVPVPTEEATHEAWTLTAAFAASTERIRLGQMCTCIGYRNPAYLAKVAATVDHVSGGRVEMAIGGGWYEDEWNAYGYGFPTDGDRLGMLDEGVQIMRQAWTEGVSTLAGKYFQVDGAICRPLPIQPGGIPLWIAGGGERKTLRIAAKYADYTNFDGTPETFAHKSDVLEHHCSELGRDFGRITRSANYNVVIGETDSEVRDRLEQIKDHYRRLVPPYAYERYARMFETGPLVGTPELIVDRLREAQRLGMSYAIANFVDVARDRSGMDLFAGRVIPELAGDVPHGVPADNGVHGRMKQ